MDILNVLEMITVILLGFVLGSFSSALIWRIPRDIPWFLEKNQNNTFVFCRSKCPQCDHILGGKDLVPVFSWIYQKGKCRYCKTDISKEYPLDEILCVLGCLGIYAVWGFNGQAVFLYATIPFLMAAFIIDLRHMILPNVLNVLIGGLALMFLGHQMILYGSAYGYDNVVINKLAGIAVFPMVALAIRNGMAHFLKKDSMGLGDVKFFAAAGAWLGLSYLPYFLITGGVFGVLTGVAYRLRGQKGIFPFGPALILALYFGLLLRGLEINPFM